MGKINLAIVSPNRDQYSETFIQFHRTRLPANVYFLFGGYLPEESEDQQIYFKHTRFNRWRKKAYKFFFPDLLDAQEAQIHKYLVKNNVQAVLAEYGMTGVAMRKICMKARIPLFVHFHGYDASKNSILEEYKETYKQLFSYASSIYVVSEHMKLAVGLLGAPPEKLILNHYGPSEIYFDVAPSYNSRSFLFVGRFVDKKAPNHVINAFKDVASAFPDAHLHMVGTGKLLDDCKRLASELNLNSNISFHGVLPPSGILKLMNSVVALVQHSVTAPSGDAEGTPVAILEASAAALPVVSTIHAGIPDVVVHEVTGFLCREHDIATMAHHMIRVLQDPEKAAKMGAAGRKRILEKFTLDQHLNRIIADIDKKLIVH